MRYVPKDSFDIEVYEKEIEEYGWRLVAKMMRHALKESTGDDYKCTVRQLNNKKQIQFQIEKVIVP